MTRVFDLSLPAFVTSNAGHESGVAIRKEDNFLEGAGGDGGLHVRITGLMLARLVMMSAALMSNVAAAQKPDLHGGGAQPSLRDEFKAGPPNARIGPHGLESSGWTSTLHH